MGFRKKKLNVGVEGVVGYALKLCVDQNVSKYQEKKLCF